MPAESAPDVVAARRRERLAGREVCVACGTRHAENGGAAEDAPYRIARSGMHVGVAPLTRDDHLCPQCRRHGRVKA